MTDDTESARLLGIVVPTLGAPEPPEFTAEDRRITQVSLAWQRLSTEARWMEGHAMLAGLPPGTYIELYGRAAATGEQLGLSLASLLDARGWLLRPIEVAHRALSALASAEVAGYFAYAAAHGLVVVTARALRIDPSAHRILQRTKAGQPDPPRFAPFEPTRQPSMNEEWVGLLRAAADASGEPAAQALVEPIERLLAAEAWVAMVGRRDQNFHRDRPQSLPTGVAFENPWEVDEHGNGVLDFPGEANYVPPDPDIAVEEASTAVSELASAMSAWIDQLQPTLVALGGTQRFPESEEHGT